MDIFNVTRKDGGGRRPPVKLAMAACHPAQKPIFGCDPVFQALTDRTAVQGHRTFPLICRPSGPDHHCRSSRSSGGMSHRRRSSPPPAAR